MKKPARRFIDELVAAVPFPDPRAADARGLVGWGGDLEPERLLSAYAQGIFPWYSEPPILWFSPDPRMLLWPDELHVSRSLAKCARKAPYRLTLDRAFREVIVACRETPRPEQDGTWITPEMVEAYCTLHRLGFAHSAEAWDGDRLVGGIYGLSLGGAFFGESMFAHAPDASKLAFVALVRQLAVWDFAFLDCQVETEHLTRFGARLVPREGFLEALTLALGAETRRGPWSFDAPGVDSGAAAQNRSGSSRNRS